MCKDASIEGNKTNHSLRATGATTMFDRGVPEKIIQERRSLEALRSYERISAQQHQEVSKLLSAPSSSEKQLVPSENFQSTHTHYQQSSISSASDSQLVSMQQSRKQLSNSVSNYCPNFSFENMQGCTININTDPLASKPCQPQYEIQNNDEKEFDNLFSLLQEQDMY